MNQLRSQRMLPKILLLTGLAIGLSGIHGGAGANPVTFLPPAGTPITLKYINHETLVDTDFSGGLSVGDTLMGVFTATSIESPDGTTTYWTPGVPGPTSDGSELNGFFTGLTVTGFAGPDAFGSVTTVFTGGTATVYNVPLGTFAPAGGPPPVPTMYCPLGICPAVPWLSFGWLPLNAFGDTQITTFSTITSTGAGLTAWLDVTGGTAAGFFDSSSFVTPLGAPADATIASTFADCPPGPAVGCAAGWAELSNDPIQAQVAPEPTTMLLWGTGLVWVGIARRRLSKRSVAAT